MTVHDYRVQSLHVRTGERIAEIPLGDLVYGDFYENGIVTGFVTGDLVLPELGPPVRNPVVLDIETEDGDPLEAEENGETLWVEDRGPVADRIRAGVYNDAVEECLRHLFVERDGVVVGDGIVWKAPYDDSTRTRKITAGSAITYLNRRRITVRRDFDNVDQLLIARTLVADALQQAAGNIGITWGSETSGVLRERTTYELWDVKNLGEALEQLASVENGFDISIDCSWSPEGNPVKLLRLHYPRRGRPQSQSNLVFEYGRNMTCDWPSDGSAMANRIHGIGDGTEASMLMSDATNPASIGAGYPMLEDDYLANSVKWQSTLDKQTRAQVNVRSTPWVLPTLIVDPDKDPELGSYISGDTAEIWFPPGTYPRFPHGYRTRRRIIGRKITVSDEGTERVEVTPGEEP